MADEDDFEAELEKSLDRADAAFRGKYKKELQELLASSSDDLGIRPRTTDADASPKNVSVGEPLV